MIKSEIEMYTNIMNKLILMKQQLLGYDGSVQNVTPIFLRFVSCHLIIKVDVSNIIIRHSQTRDKSVLFM